ncbi:MAG: DAK2 domain-containing protein, partial [Chloroflexota bacterium]|nr:DAK2 domain-containing protein [Chloroflexota bacterium]
QGTAGSFDELRMASGHRPSAEERSFGYCTEFLIQGEGLDGEQVKQKLSSLGESVLVVGYESTLRVHLHSLDPGAALSYATSLGSLRQVKVEDMEEQHRHLLALQDKASSGIWPVAVASGEGLAKIFRSLGAKAIVSGGHTMNPSVQELLEAVEAAPISQVVLLPNNSNIIPAAQQVQALTAKEVAVVPTRSIPQGVAALLAFNPEATLTANAAAMERASNVVRTGEVTTAVRSMKWDGLSVEKGQAIGLLDGKLVEAGASRPAVTLSLLSRMGLGEGKMVTLYCGAEADPREAEEVLRALKERFPGLEAEAVAGGQPHYYYILSVE